MADVAVHISQQDPFQSSKIILCDSFFLSTEQSVLSFLRHSVWPETCCSDFEASTSAGMDNTRQSTRMGT